MAPINDYYSNQKATSREKYFTHLVEEIAYLEGRLIAIGHTGDCAYEKALAKSYQELLQERRKQLTALRSRSRLAGYICQEAAGLWGSS